MHSRGSLQSLQKCVREFFESFRMCSMLCLFMKTLSPNPQKVSFFGLLYCQVTSEIQLRVGCRCLVPSFCFSILVRCSSCMTGSFVVPGSALGREVASKVENMSRSDALTKSGFLFVSGASASKL